MSNEFSIEERKELLRIARKTIEHHLEKGNKLRLKDVSEKSDWYSLAIITDHH